MRPQPCQDPIVPAGATVADGAGRQLWQRLDPQAWPLPLAELPAGSAVVGGAVRDGLLGRLAQRPDLDLVVPNGAIALCQRLARQLGGSAVVLDGARDIARLVLKGWSFDLAACEGGSLEADLRRRDYSVNAIALPLDDGPNPAQELLDPCGGLAALARRELVAISEANLLSDPLRLLRGLRLGCELGFTLTPQSQEWIAHHSPRLAAVASERVLAELEKLACSPNGAAGLLQVARSGLLQPWLQETTVAQETLGHLSLPAAQGLGLSDAELAWALPLARLACLADAAALERLRSSRSLQKRVGQLRHHWQHLAGRPPQELPEAERFGLHRSLEADLPALLLLLPGGAAQELLLRWRDPGDPLCHPQPPCSGLQLQDWLGLQPGPRLGALLQHLSQERAFGRLAADATDAAVIETAQAWLARL
ncbi:MAG: CCA tRNA nucleotidyltransferase [Cyanobacteriota bacterium]|nr:CCA tRNA nucleotidyltransferase [Cyanobacteriota bacterium]